MIFLLGHHPEIQDKCRQEVFRVLGSDPSTFMTSEHVKMLTYLEASFKVKLNRKTAFVHKLQTQRIREFIHVHISVMQDMYGELSERAQNSEMLLKKQHFRIFLTQILPI